MENLGHLHKQPISAVDFMMKETNFSHSKTTVIVAVFLIFAKSVTITVAFLKISCF